MKPRTMKQNFLDAIAALEALSNSPTARIDARVWAKHFRRRLKSTKTK